MSKSIGRIGGAVVGGLLGGPGGAVAGYQIGNSVDKGSSGGSSQQGSMTQTTTPNVPAYVTAFQQNLFNRAQEAAYGKPGFFGFGGTPGLQARQFADFSPLQNQGFSALSGVNQNAGMMGAQDALAGLQGMGFGADLINPMMVSGTGYNATLANAGTLGDAERVQAMNFLQGNIGAYQNPYTEQVINTSLADLDRARMMQQQGVNAQALSRGAFGGSRQAISEAENNRNFLDQQARTSAGLRQQGFDTAAGLMQQDMARALQAGLSNQQAANQFALSRYGQEADTSRFNAANQTAASQFGADAAMRAALANQAAGLTAGTQNANNQLQAQQLGLAAKEAALTGGLNLNRTFLGNAAAMIDAGQAQQTLEQNRLDAARNAPLEQLQILQSTLSGGQLPTGSTVTRPLYGNNTSGLLGSIGAFAANNPQAVSKVGGFLGGLPGMAQNAYYNWNSMYGTPYGTSEGE